MQSCSYIKQSFFSVISAQNRNSQCPSGASVTWGFFVRTLCGDFMLNSMRLNQQNSGIKKLQDVKTSETSNPLLVSGSLPPLVLERWKLWRSLLDF